MALRVYGFPVSQPSRSMYMLLDDAGIEHERITINLPAQQQKSPEYLAINPSGQVPAIDDNGFKLSEGGAILAYLAESRSIPNVYPADLQVRAKINFWLHWNHTNTRNSTTKLLRPVVFKRPLTGEGKAAVSSALSFLDAHLATSTFLVGDKVTIADYFILPELDQIEWLGVEVFDLSPFPNVLRYLAALKAAIPSYEKNSAKAIVSTFATPKKLKLYGFVVSQPTRTLLMLLDDAGVSYDFVPVNIMKREHKQPEFLAVNPAGLVPAIDDGGFSLGESGAILQYLSDTRDLGSLYPADAKVRARVNFWVHWNHTNTRASTTKFLHPLLHGQAVDEKDRQKYVASVGFLDTHLAALDGQFVAGTATPTVADLLLIPEIDQLEWFPGAFDYSPFPHVQRWLEACKTSVKSYGARAEPAKAIVDSVVNAAAAPTQV